MFCRAGSVENRGFGGPSSQRGRGRGSGRGGRRGEGRGSGNGQISDYNSDVEHSDDKGYYTDSAVLAFGGSVRGGGRDSDGENYGASRGRGRGGKTGDRQAANSISGRGGRSSRGGQNQNEEAIDVAPSGGNRGVLLVAIDVVVEGDDLLPSIIVI